MGWMRGRPHLLFHNTSSTLLLELFPVVARAGSSSGVISCHIFFTRVAPFPAYIPNRLLLFFSVFLIPFFHAQAPPFLRFVHLVLIQDGRGRSLFWTLERSVGPSFLLPFIPELHKLFRAIWRVVGDFSCLLSPATSFLPPHTIAQLLNLWP